MADVRATASGLSATQPGTPSDVFAPPPRSSAKNIDIFLYLNFISAQSVLTFLGRRPARRPPRPPPSSPPPPRAPRSLPAAAVAAAVAACTLRACAWQGRSMSSLADAVHVYDSSGALPAYHALRMRSRSAVRTHCERTPMCSIKPHLLHPSHSPRPYPRPHCPPHCPLVRQRSPPLHCAPASRGACASA